MFAVSTVSDCRVSSQVVLSVQAGQQIQFELYDKDLDSDDFLGRCVCVPSILHSLMLDLELWNDYID